MYGLLNCDFLHNVALTDDVYSGGETDGALELILQEGGLGSPISRWKMLFEWKRVISRENVI